MKGVRPADIPHVAAALRADGLPEGGSTRWWATQILVLDGFRAGVGMEAVIQEVMGVLEKHPERSADYTASPGKVIADLRRLVHDTYAGMPDQPSLVSAVEAVTGQEAWLSSRDVTSLVMGACRLCGGSRSCEVDDEGFIVPIAHTLVRAWLPHASRAGVSKVIGAAVRAGVFEVVQKAARRQATTYRVHIHMAASSPFLGSDAVLADLCCPSLGDLLGHRVEGVSIRQALGELDGPAEVGLGVASADSDRKILDIDLAVAAHALTTTVEVLRARWCLPEHGFEGDLDGRARFSPPPSVWRAPRKAQRATDEAQGADHRDTAHTMVSTPINRSAADRDST